MKPQQLQTLTTLTDKENSTFTLTHRGAHTYTHTHTHTHTSGPLFLSFILAECFPARFPRVTGPGPLRWGEVRFGVTGLCHLDRHSHRLAHVNTCTHTDIACSCHKLHWQTPGPGYWSQRESWILCACLCVYKWGVWGILGQCWRLCWGSFDFFPPCFLSPWIRGPTQASLENSSWVTATTSCKPILLKYSIVSCDYNIYAFLHTIEFSLLLRN